MKRCMKSETYQSKVGPSEVTAHYDYGSLSVVLLAKENTKHIYLHLGSESCEAWGKELLKLSKELKKNKGNKQ